MLLFILPLPPSGSFICLTWLFLHRIPEEEVQALTSNTRRNRHRMARSGDPNWTPYFDTHFHYEFLYPKEVANGNLRRSSPWHLSLLERNHPYPFPKDFVGGLSIWCHPDHYHKLPSVVDADKRIFAAIGCHPHFCRLYDLKREVEIAELIDYSPQVVSWGEIGLDYNCEGGRSPDPQRQREVFKSQLRAAVRRDLPIVIHGRDAEEDLLKVMSRSVPHNYPSIHRHCVTLPPSSIACFREHFIYAKYGFTNKLTRPGNEGRGIRETVSSLPLHKILTETDAPWHLPSGWRTPSTKTWRRSYRTYSHPGMVDAVVASIAAVKAIPIYEVAQATYKNACSLYGL